MRRRNVGTARVWLTLAAVAAAVAAVALPVASAAGIRASRMPRATGRLTRVVVVLRDRPAGLGARSSARSRIVRAEQSPLVALLRSHGARNVKQGRALPYVVARVSAAQRKALASNPLVAAVMRDTMIPLASPSSPSSGAKPSGKRAHVLSPAEPSNASPASICGTESSPENDPQAISAINAPQANALGYNGAGVTVGYIAGPIDPTIADFKRNAAYASPGSPAGSSVVSSVNFSGDPESTPDYSGAGTESFLDASSIASQGNTVFNLDNFISSTHSLPSPCDITVTGAAPGANVMGLDVFSNTYQTPESNFIEAIDYAVSHGVKVLNESFGANNFPDTAEDVTRLVDNAAVAAGVTVVVSTGDAGVTSTQGSPATDPLLISAGATTTFRSYEQDFYGGINATTPNASNGTWLDNNISSMSSGGFAQTGGNTVDVVAPGDLNWIDCSTNSRFAGDCTDNNGNPSGLLLEGGTSESSPLTAAAAADVIQAYASTHGGTDPSPALVKQILMSTATDINSPADQQGAGLLNVLAAVKEAISLPGSTSTSQGGLLVSPNQINITQNPKATTNQPVSVTNTGSSPVTVNLSTRTFTKQVGSQTGSFCLNPSKTTISCGPPTTNTFQIWSGITEVYREETFSVPSTAGVSRLDFSADYPYTAQSSTLHVALYDPSGAYAGYSIPQGFGDYANIQVSNPKPGKWTAVFFTEQNGATDDAVGTSGKIQWQATTYQATSAGSITPSSLTIAPGATGTATFSATSSDESGDTAQSIVLSTTGGAQNTIPVTVRTLVPLTSQGGNFRGTLTGGNGRAGSPAQTSTYQFQVPAGLKDLDVAAQFADIGDGVVAFLQDPEGNTVASSSNVTLNDEGTTVIGTKAVNVYKDSPEAGTWFLTLDWLQPVSGAELAEPFTGSIRFNKVDVSSSLPQTPSVQLQQGKSYTFNVRVRNTAQSPEAFFLDPRTDANATIPLADLGGPAQDMTLPLAPGAFPFYIVPPDTTQIQTSVAASGPVTYDTEPFPGDPDLSPLVAAPGVTATQNTNSASLNFTPGGEVSPGLWYLMPSEFGPYGQDGAKPETANASFAAVTPAFDATVLPSTGDLWSVYNGYSAGFTPVYLKPGHSAVVPLTITPTATPGSVVSGSINVDDTFQVAAEVGFTNAGGDELASLPFTYGVIAPK